MGVIVGIQARMSSSRLPGKSLMDIGGEPMIRRVWDACGENHRRVLLTSNEKSDDQLVAYATMQGWPVRRGSLSDVLSRYVNIAAYEHPEVLVRVCGDAPLLDKRWVYRAVDAVYETKGPVFVPDVLHAGTSDDWLRFASEAMEEDIEHAAAYLFEEHGKRINMAPPGYFSVNTQEDLDEARKRWAEKH